MSTQPTDAEIDELWRFEASKNWDSTLAMRTSFARAVLAKWGQPAVAVEPVAYYEYNADLDAWFLAYSHNPKAKTRPLVFGDTAPQPSPAAQGDAIEHELAMLIRRIVLSARRNCQDGSNVLKLANEAWAYLVRKGLVGSPLRDAGIESDVAPQAADSVLEQIFDADQMLAFADATCALRPSHGQAPAQPNATPHPACKADILVNGGALKLALNVLRRAGKNEVADELETTATPQAADTGAAVPDLQRLHDLLYKAQLQTTTDAYHSAITAARIELSNIRAAAPQPAPPADSVMAPGGGVVESILAAARSQLSQMRAQRKSLEGFLALGNEVSRAALLDEEIQLLAGALDATQAADSVLEDATHPIAVLVAELRKHRFCGDCYPENGWPGVNDALARYELWKRAARKQGGSHD